MPIHKVTLSPLAAKKLEYDLQMISEYDGKPGFTGERERLDAEKVLRHLGVITSHKKASLDSITNFFKDLNDVVGKTFVSRIDGCKTIDACDGLEPKINHRTSEDCQKPDVTVCETTTSKIEMTVSERDGDMFFVKDSKVVETKHPYAKADIDERGFVAVEDTPYVPLNDRK